MNITIKEHAAPRVLNAIKRRQALLQMYTRDMPGTYEAEMVDLDRIIASAVSTSFKRQMTYGEKYEALSRGY